MLSKMFSIVIVNYNGGHYLREALASLADQSRQDFEIIIVDNASTDRSMDSLDLSLLPSVQIIRNSDNLGFAAANNMAAKVAEGKWLVLLNPDATAQQDWLEQLSRASIRHADCRVFTSAQLDMKDEALMDGAGDAYLLFGIPWRGGYGRPLTELPYTGYCFSGCGAGVMYDRQLFLDTGGFDERFFCYCEDVDLGFRLQLAGEDCIFVREAVIYHAGSAISGLRSPFAIYHGTRNRMWTYFKNMPLPLLVLTFPIHVVLSIYLLIRSPFAQHFKPTAKGMVDGILGLPEILGSSKWHTSTRRISLWYLARRMAWNPFRMSHRRTHVRPLSKACSSTVSQPAE